MKKIALLIISILTLIMLFGCGKDDTDDSTKESGNIPSQETCIHSFDSWRVSVPATCIKAGEEARICTKCTFVEKRETKKADHTSKDVSKKDSTCTEQGHEAGVQCSVCGVAINGMAVIEKKPHSYVDRICTACGAVQVSQGLTYEPYDGGNGYTVSGRGTCADKIIAIPEEYKGLPVRKIGERAFTDEDITTVYLPETLWWIGNGAFSGCGAITKLEIPKSVTEIGRDAFYGCDGIVTTVDGVEYVGKWATYGDGENIVIKEGTVGVANSCLAFNPSILSIKLPSSLKYIGTEAFVNCTNLTEINIPSQIEIIGTTAFAGCSNAIEYEDGLGYIDKVLVSVSSDLREQESITVRNGTVAIGDSTFTDFTSLKSIVIPSSVRVINSFAFSWCSSLTSITLPENLVFVGAYAFANCNNLRGITVGDGLKYVMAGAFDKLNVTVSENNPYFKAENGSLVPKK